MHKHRFMQVSLFTPTIKMNLHRHYPDLHALEYPLFALPPNIFLPPLMSPTWLPTKSPTFLSVTTPHKTITYWFSIISLSDILPTCLRHFSPTFTLALPPLLPPHYRQDNVCTDIYTDIYTDKTASTFSVHRPALN